MNGVVVVEQGLGLVNFRPRLRLPLWVPLSGSLSSLLAMLIINPAISILSISSMLLLYAVLSQNRGDNVEEEQGDVRGNIFVALARWFAREAQKLPKSEARAWVPSPLCPIIDEQVCRNALELAGDIAFPRGQVKLLRITKLIMQCRNYLRWKNFVQERIRFASTIIQHSEKTTALLCAMQTLRGEVFFAPNILSLGIDDGYSENEIHSYTNGTTRWNGNCFTLSTAEKHRSRRGH